MWNGEQPRLHDELLRRFEVSQIMEILIETCEEGERCKNEINCYTCKCGILRDALNTEKEIRNEQDN